MLRSMYSGISGMKNFQTKLDVIGNNISNVNTYGFKKGRVTFKDTMNQMLSGATASTETRGGKNAVQVGMGSVLGTIDNIHTTGNMQTTGRSLDLGVDGDGYFIVNQGNQSFYTRAGNFYLDDNGTLVNSNGLKVQAFQFDNNGDLTNQLGDVAINVNGLLPAVPSTSISFSDNLSANAIIDTVFSQQIVIVDDKGERQNSTIYYQKVADNVWEIYANENPKTDETLQPIHTLTFVDGKIPENAATEDVPFSIPTGLTDDPTTPDDESTQEVTLEFDFSNLTQYDGATTALINPNGNIEGALESFSIGSSGEIVGVYSNGQLVTLGQLAVAKFTNSSGLLNAGGNLFQESISSGNPDIDIPGEGRGTLMAGSLEMSNVDLSEEFTEMITAQRGFQANTRIITTSDEILQELVNLKR